MLPCTARKSKIVENASLVTSAIARYLTKILHFSNANLHLAYSLIYMCIDSSDTFYLYI